MAVVIIAVVLVVFNSAAGSTPSGLKASAAPSGAGADATGSMIGIMQGLVNGADAAAAAAGTVANTGAASGSIPSAVGVTSTAPGAGASSTPRPINTDPQGRQGGPQG